MCRKQRHGEDKGRGQDQAPPGWLGGPPCATAEAVDRASGTRRGKPPDLSPPGPHSGPRSWLPSQAPTEGTAGPVMMLVVVVVVVVVSGGGGGGGQWGAMSGHAVHALLLAL